MGFGGFLQGKLRGDDGPGFPLAHQVEGPSQKVGAEGGPMVEDPQDIVPDEAPAAPGGPGRRTATALTLPLPSSPAAASNPRTICT